MKKRMLALLLLAAMVLCLAACGGGTNSSASVSVAADTEKVEQTDAPTAAAPEEPAASVQEETSAAEPEAELEPVELPLTDSETTMTYWIPISAPDMKVPLSRRSSWMSPI